MPVRINIVLKIKIKTIHNIFQISQFTFTFITRRYYKRKQRNIKVCTIVISFRLAVFKYRGKIASIYSVEADSRTSDD